MSDSYYGTNEAWIALPSYHHNNLRSSGDVDIFNNRMD